MALAKEKRLFDLATDYEDDFYAWCFEQAELLRQKRFGEVDLPNVIEELESTGRSDKRELQSRFETIIIHLPKWQFQPEQRSRSWQTTLGRERLTIEAHEEESATLRNEAALWLDKLYSRARRHAASEIGLPIETFPPACPYTIAQLRDHDFLPE